MPANAISGGQGLSSPSPTGLAGNVRIANSETRAVGRPVVSCTVAGQGVAGWLARQGWARDYTGYSRGAYSLQESQAREARRGIWHGEDIAPKAWRGGERLKSEQANTPGTFCMNVTASEVPIWRHRPLSARLSRSRESIAWGDEKAPPRQDQRRSRQFPAPRP